MEVESDVLAHLGRELFFAVELAVGDGEGEPASTHHVNRIFMAHENTLPLLPGSRLVNGLVSCAVAEGAIRVMCAVGSEGFAVDKQGVELG